VAEVLQAVENRSSNLLDVRTSDEFTGKITAPVGMTENAHRGGHIPGAICAPWRLAVQSDGTMRPAPELHEVYFNQKGLDPNKPTIVYGRIGERCSHSWFVAKYLLGLPDVRNYDGGWTEYGNMIGLPIERSA
jgi:thiosulfate/3-mercaptopyruvate sulfurtransferase